MTETPNFLIQEANPNTPTGIPMTEEQAYYLHDYIDPFVENLINNLESEKNFSWREHWEKIWRKEAGI